MTDVVLAALVLAPLAITFLLKSNAALAFLALCAGFALISFTNIDIRDLTKNLSFQINSGTLNLILLVTPYALTLLLNRKAYSGQFKTVLQLTAAVSGGALLALLAIPLLNESVRLSFAHNAVWDALQKIQSPLVGTGVFVSLMLVWFGKKAESGSKKHK